jgi:large subunit ribosomal protein L25
MEVVKISGEPRTGTGKKDAKATRVAGGIPCVMYGGNENIHFSTKLNEVRHIIYTPDFKLAEITVGGQTYKAILKDAQFHPANESVLHLDFLRLIPTVPIRVQVPLRLEGSSPGVKSGGKLVQSVRRIKVKCTPETLVEEVRLNIGKLELGQSSRVRDIIPTPGVEVMMAPAIPVVLIEIPRALRSAAQAEAKAKK